MEGLADRHFVQVSRLHHKGHHHRGLHQGHHHRGYHHHQQRGNKEVWKKHSSMRTCDGHEPEDPDKPQKI